MILAEIVNFTMSPDQKLGHYVCIWQVINGKEPIYFNEAQTHDKRLNYLFHFLKRIFEGLKKDFD